LNIRRFLDHRRQSLDNLIFRGKQHPQLVTIKAPQGLKVGREKFHLLAPFKNIGNELSNVVARPLWFWNIIQGYLSNAAKNDSFHTYLLGDLAHSIHL
jgi:hypothetical protein